MKIVDELIDVFLYGNDEISYAFNRHTKEIISDMPESLTGEPQIDLDDDDVVEVLIQIPQISSTECYDLMVTFSKGLDDDIAALLVEVLNGKMPFKTFKDKVSEHGIENKWYDFENNYAKIKMVEWLEEHA